MTSAGFDERVTQIRDNLAGIRARMTRAAEKSDRNPNEIKLIAVTKLLSLETICAGMAAGLHAFGENYAEQAAEKIAALKGKGQIEWHMIGHIQSRKAETVCQYFDMVHSVDRLKIARYIDRYAQEAGKMMPVLIEVNVSGEESKYGWDAWDEARWQALIPEFQKILEMKNLQVKGLMSMPPFFDDPERTRPLYRRLRKMQNFLRKELPKATWDELSIGTSFDFEVAIEEGATMVRIGTEIFGARPEA